MNLNGHPILERSTALWTDLSVHFRFVKFQEKTNNPVIIPSQTPS